MKLFKQARKYGFGAAVMAASGAAFADATAAATAISGVSADVETIGWAALGVLIVAAGFKYMRRAV